MELTRDFQPVTETLFINMRTNSLRLTSCWQTKHSTSIRFVIVFLICVLGCGKNNDLGDSPRCKVETKIGQDDDIVGNWKLIKGQAVFDGPKTTDYSCDNVIYKFQEDGILVVSSDTKTVIGIDAGQYAYQLHHELLESSDEEFTLQIDGLTMGIEISTDAMIINHSYLDGPILHFVRIR